MKLTTIILVALATLAAASPAHHRRDSHGPDHSQGAGVGGYGGHSGLGGYGVSHGSSGPCDMSSEDTGCHLISDNSGCFLNMNNATRVLECVDPAPSVAIDIFCRCWGCNGDQLTNFMPTLNCTSHTVISPARTSTSISTRLPLSTGTGVGTATSATTAAPTSPIHGYENTTTTWAKNHTRMPVLIVSYISHG